MNKILRISVFTLLMLCCNTFISAADVTLNFKDLSVTTTSEGFTLTEQGYTLTATKEKGSNAPIQNNKYKDVRLYAKNTLTVAGNAFKQIVFNISKQGLRRWCDVTPSVGEMTADVAAKTLTWTNSTAVKEVTFTVGDDVTLGTDPGKAGQFDFDAMVISTESGEVTPTPDPNPDPEIKTAADIAAFKALPAKTVAKLTLKDAQVLYKWTSNKGNTQIFIRDHSGALMLFNAGLDLETNDILNGEVVLLYDIYNNTPEGAKADGTNADKLTITKGQAATPKSITIDQAKDYMSDLVQIEGAEIKSEQSGTHTNYYAHVGDQKIQLYNGFHLDAYNELSTFEGVKNKTVKGIVSMFNRNYQITFISIDTTTGIDNLNAENKTLNENAPMYNLAGLLVDKTYKGVVIQNGKKFIKR